MAMDKAIQMGKDFCKRKFPPFNRCSWFDHNNGYWHSYFGCLLPVADVGLYGMALIPSSMINFFRDWGVNYAMTQQIANLRIKRQRNSEIHDVIVSGIIFEIITGVIFL